MVYCYDPYPTSFQGHRKLLLSSINSAPARLARICLYHPGVRDRIDSLWDLGYPPHFPETLFRCEFILALLKSHIRVIKMDSLTAANIATLVKNMMALKQVYMVI